MRSVNTQRDRTIQEVRKLAADNPLNMMYPLGHDTTQTPRTEAVVDSHVAVRSYLAQFDINSRLGAIRALDLTLHAVRRETVEEQRQKRIEEIQTRNNGADKE